jgi:hypothetical protein
LFAAASMSVMPMRLILRIRGLIMIMRAAGGEQRARKKNQSQPSFSQNDQDRTAHN